MHADEHSHERAEALLERALDDELTWSERIELDHHLADCPDCSTALETARAFQAATVADRGDDALNVAAVAGAMARLAHRDPFGQRVRAWLHGQPRWRPAAAFAALGVAAAVVAVIVVVRGHGPAASPQSPVAATGSLLLPDGSEVTPMGTATAIEVAEDTPSLTTVRLRSGAAQFRVRHDQRRRFRVDAGTVKIDDIGTFFRVEHQATGRVRVAVFEGRVAVLYDDESARVELGPGESRVFPPSVVPVETVETVETTVDATRPAPPPVRTGSRIRASEDPAGLLAAADVARRSRDPGAAVAPLRRMLERYPKDPRTPSAAFTLGWILLTDLGRAREAAAAFTEAERMAPRGALAEDAAARVAEAWQKAGEPRRAAEAARHYQRTYPSGRYTSLMRGLVGEH